MEGLSGSLVNITQFDSLSKKNQEEHNLETPDPQLIEGFPQFPQLSIEIRLIIWEHTWPEAQIIEAAICEEDENAEEYINIGFLRPAGPLALALDNELFWTRTVESEPLDKFSYPMALHICKESRRHTLTKYRVMEHSKTAKGRFCFNPEYDIVWFSLDFIHDIKTESYLVDLEDCYGGQLNAVETLLVEDFMLQYEGLDAYSDCLLALSSLKAIFIRLGNDAEDMEMEVRSVIDEDEDEGSDQSRGDDFQEDASELKEEYRKFLEDEHGMRVEVLCIDHTGNVI
ncbi:hypothetical protein LOCC1_G006509 [Lachnellula occidentalis]|uniref:2EXR domain-containing protein n=1 Tax=Lachnellula occidentalis TaxID=215460 RepID=A0A8H8RW82_9HELO|nr:hypothetical protein LOCC1_G006509 [Lachnellula occidentalis]